MNIDIDKKYYFVRDYVNKRVIKALNVKTHDQVADALTKALGQAQFHHLIGKMVVLNIHSS